MISPPIFSCIPISPTGTPNVYVAITGDKCLDNYPYLGDRVLFSRTSARCAATVASMCRIPGGIGMQARNLGVFLRYSHRASLSRFHHDSLNIALRFYDK